MTSGLVTLDRFLGGRLSVAQPKGGFRAGHESVLVAAAVPAGQDDSVLELGAGAGVASLCLGLRVPGVRVLGIEIDADLVALANENAVRNTLEERVHFEVGDVARLSREDRFDHVFFNPPFHPLSGQESPNLSLARAKHMGENALLQWTRAALGLTRSGGTVTAIMRADRVAGMLAAKQGAVLFPLFPHAGEPPKRAIVQILKDGTKPLRNASGLVLHKHDGGNTEAAEAVLRHGAELRLA